jgi:hypothetical protein
VCLFELAKSLVDLDHEAATATLDYRGYSTGTPEFLDALSSLEGLVPLKSPRGGAFARTYGGVLAVYVPSSVFLDENTVRRLLEEVRDLDGGKERVRIYYHRGQQPSAVDGGVIIEYRMIPFDLQIAAGCL